MSFVDESTCYVALPEKGPLLEHSPRALRGGPERQGDEIPPSEKTFRQRVGHLLWVAEVARG